MTRYLIVDLNNMMYRCLHSSSGEIDIRASMALHITLNAVRSSWRKFNIEHIVFCLEGKSWRYKLYPQYKAHRRAQETMLNKREREDMDFFFRVYDQFKVFLNDKTNATVLQCPVAEADDMIARWIQVHPNDEHIILSSDKDFYQLLADNVRIYDGMKGWTISNKVVLDENDKPAVVKKNKSVVDKVTKKKIKESVTYAVEPPNPQYELFLKIIRGDSSDNIMSAYPGVREKGSDKKPGIKEAFDDRDAQGFHWNNFMLQEWNKLVGQDEQGLPIVEKVRVIDEYKINQQLVDLTKQPDDVKLQMDETISVATLKNKVPMVGIHFLKYANDMDLVNISKNPNDFANMLAASYK